MNLTRRDFLSNSLAALGFAALPGGLLFAAPKGWKHKGDPKLVFGVISDTHLRTAVRSNNRGANWPDKYFVAALEHFKAAEVDAVVHCGDMAHRGQVRELEFHAEAWRRVFGDVNKGPVKLFVTGNHDTDGANYGGFVKKRYPDPVERAKRTLVTDMAANWERIWGEKYEPVWHKVVKGYHFFGRHWRGAPPDAISMLNEWTSDGKPFFYIQHRRPRSGIRSVIMKHKGGIAFFGHNHWSISNWNVPSLYKGRLPVLQCASCEPRGCGALVGDGWITKAKIEKGEHLGRGRQGYVVRVYDDMLVVERREFGSGGVLGSDWVMPFGGQNPHPFSKSELKKAIGCSEFRKDARLDVSIQDSDMKIRIPLADGNPDSRVYAYEVSISSLKDRSKTLLKAVYATGCNLGMGHEPNGGITELTVPKTELPSGKEFSVSVQPLTSLGTRGKAIAAKLNV